jgi:hypothetical protein
VNVVCQTTSETCARIDLAHWFQSSSASCMGDAYVHMLWTTLGMDGPGVEAGT